MRLNSRNILVAVAGLVILTILVSACASGSEGATAQVAEPTEGEHEEEEGEEHEDEDEHAPEEHMEGEHDVPDDAAAVPNPFVDHEESLAAGAVFYASNCAICHGETGEGDGPAASGLEVAPSDLHEGHVQDLSDGALFYIISHGKPETPMPAWEDVLEADERWHVVNFLRTFQ